MRLASYRIDGRESYGVVDPRSPLDAAETAGVVDIPSVLEGGAPATLADFLAAGLATSDAGRALLERDFAEGTPLGALDLLPVSPDPRNIVAVGVNYREHATETHDVVPDFPLIFSKFTSSIAAHGTPIRIPPACAQPDYEAELGVVIGRPAFEVAVEDALDHVGGYVAFDDVSARDFQSRTSQWTQGKGFPTFGPTGPYLVTPDEFGPPSGRRLRLVLNGEVLQDASTDDMVFDVATLVSYVSSVCALRPGDIIATGTPSGRGDRALPAAAPASWRYRARRGRGAARARESRGVRMNGPGVLAVTGSARGIGRAVALAAAAQGYPIAGIDVDEEGGRATAAAAAALGVAAAHFTCDLARPAEVTATFERIEREVGPVEHLVNNAAIGSHTAPESLGEAEWRRIIDVDLGAAVFACQAVGRSLIARGRPGSIVNISSIAGLAALGRGNYAYSIAKAGLIGLTRELAVEWAGYGIRVNVVAPSQVDTEGFRPLIGASDIAGGNTLGAALAGIPLGRLAQPADVAATVLFLLGEDASFLTGVTIPVDGGSMALHAGGSLRADAPSEGAE